MPYVGSSALDVRSGHFFIVVLVSPHVILNLILAYSVLGSSKQVPTKNQAAFAVIPSQSHNQKVVRAVGHSIFCCMAPKCFTRKLIWFHANNLKKLCILPFCFFSSSIFRGGGETLYTDNWKGEIEDAKGVSTYQEKKKICECFFFLFYSNNANVTVFFLISQ